MINFIKKILRIKHKCDFTKVAENRWGKCTYKVCFKCGKSERWKGATNGHYEPCERIPELDNQFDSKGNYIFNHNKP